MRVVPPNVGPSVAFVNTQGKRQGVKFKNVGSVDIFWSDDQRTLDNVPSGGVPNEGFLLAAATQDKEDLFWFFGKLYFRAVSAGASLQILQYDVDYPNCVPGGK